MANKITKFNDDVTKWYNDIIQQADLIDYGLVKGSVVLKPYSFAIWKNIQNIMTQKFIEDDIEELYFPLLIPYKSLEVEKKHIEGFSPEVFIVTKIGDKTIEPLVIRPTSEILFTRYFKDNVKTYKQLPIKLNQWVNVLRGEKNTRPFLRTSEFLWQEGHTIHETSLEAMEYSKKIFHTYKDFFNNSLDIFVLSGEKTTNERFAGADNTFTIEVILKDGKALQSGTSHYLGTTFTKSFGVKVQNSKQKEFFPFQTSWGISTRVIGAIIMSHSDDFGLVLPWDVSPYHIVIATHNPKRDEEVTNYANSLKDKLSKMNYKVKLDDSDKSIGFKASEWEVKGVPIRIELGKRDIENNSIIFVDRFTNKKISLNEKELSDKYIIEFKNSYKQNLFNQSKYNHDSKIKIAQTMDDLKLIIEENNVATCYWSEDSEYENDLQTKIEGATIRMIKTVEEVGSCIHSNKKVNTMVFISKGY